MEEFFRFHQSPENIFWVEEAAFPARQSAFVKYAVGPTRSNNSAAKSSHRSVNKRMVEFLRKSWNPVTTVGNGYERERCRRHMIKERMRREKQKQSYSALHSLLPPGTKSDKNSIIQVATKEVEELWRYKEELERRNREIEEILEAREMGKQEVAKIRLRVANPSSGVDSMVEVLKCLKKMGSNTKSIESKFSAQELSAVLEIESQIEAAKVENAVQRTLFEVERKLLSHFPNGRNFPN